MTAKLEVELGKPTDARPGAPPPHLRTAKAFLFQHQAPASGAVCRPCHRGPAAKAKGSSLPSCKSCFTSKFSFSCPRSLNLNRLQLLLDRERLHQLQLPMLHWQLQNPSRFFPLHLLQMGNVLWCLWERGRGFPPSASWTGRTMPSCLPRLLQRWRMTSLFLFLVV